MLDVAAALYNGIKNALRPLREEAVQVVLYETADGLAFKCHGALCSYVSNIPETEALLLSKRLTQANSQFYRRLASHAEPSGLT